MRNTQRIIGMIRTGEYPEAMILPLMQADASTVVERVVSSTGTATIRSHVVDYVREVYDAAAEIIRREVGLRAAAALDAADATARYEAQRAEAIGLVYDLIDSPDDLTDEERAEVEKAPVFVARVMIGGHGFRHALRMLAERDAQIEALKAKAART